MTRLILFNKPYGVISQFTDVRSETARPTLSAFIDVPGVGRIAILTEPGGAGVGWITPSCGAAACG